MVDVWLVVVSVIGSLLMAALAFYILIYYSHPDDSNQAYGPKVVVVLTLFISEISVLLIALDVANQGGVPGCKTWGGTTACGGLDLVTAWQAMFGISLVFVAIVIPFTAFFYEAQEEGRSTKSRLCEALQYQGVAIAAAALVLGLTWTYLNEFAFPITSVSTADLTQFTNCPLMGGDPVLARSCLRLRLNQTIPGEGGGGLPEYEGVTPPPVAGPTFRMVTVQLINPNTTMQFDLDTGPALTVYPLTQQHLSVPNTFFVFLGCIMSFVGWFLFCIYTGVGLITLPIDLCKAYKNRPRYIPKNIYIALRDNLHSQVKELIVMGQKMKDDWKLYDRTYDNTSYSERYRKSRDYGTNFRAFKRAVELAEDDWEDIYICHEAWKSFNPLVPIFKLVLGILSGILSLVWILQICLFMVGRYPWPNGPPVTYLLNDLMTWGLLRSGFALIGLFFLALFGVYLLFANINGNFKIGLRFLIVEIHPMKIGGTYMSSFLINVLLLVLQMPALVNFLSMAFSETVANCDTQTIMLLSVRYTTFFKYFFDNNVFVFLLLGFALLSICLMYAFPDDREAYQIKRLNERTKKMEEEQEKQNRKNITRKKLGMDEGSAFAKVNQGLNGGGDGDMEDVDLDGEPGGGGGGANFDGANFSSQNKPNGGELAKS